MPDLDRQETRTCLFTDIVSSTDRTARLGPQTGKRIITRTFELFRQCLPKDSRLNPKAEKLVDNYVNGRIVADTGDGVFADFTTVGAAIETALKFQWLMAHEKWETEQIEIRMGIDTGDVSFREDAAIPEREIPVGDVTNRAARIMSCALGGQILISEGVSYHGRQKVVGVHPCAIHLSATEVRPEIDYWEIGHVRYKGDQVDAGAPPVLLYEVGVKGQLKKHIIADPEKCRPCDRKGRLAPMAPEFTPVAGKQVPDANGGPWVLERRLARGGFGEVWLARHAVRLGEHNTRVFKFPNDPARVRAFLRETNLADILKDKNLKGVVQVEEYREKPCFIATRFYRNGSLLEWSAVNKEAFARLSQQQRINFVIELSRIVHGAHQIGIAHKDIKPANVFIEDDTTVLRPVLADFGVGDIFLDELREEYQQGQSRDLRHPVTIMGSARTGTDMYWPPEYKKIGPLSDEAARKADVYALGVLLYQMVIGDFNQPWESAQECERRISDDPSCPLNPFLRKVVAETLDAVEHRLKSAEELACRLESLEEESKASVEARLKQAEKARMEAERRTRRFKQILVTVSCLALTTVVLALVAIRQTQAAVKAGEGESAALKEAERNLAKAELAMNFMKQAYADAEDQRKKATEEKTKAEEERQKAEMSAAQARLAQITAETNKDIARQNAFEAWENARKAAEAANNAKIERDEKSSLLRNASASDHEAALESDRVGRKSEAGALFARALRYNPENQGALRASGMHVFGSRLVTRTVASVGGVIDMQFDLKGRRLVAGCDDGTLRAIVPETGMAYVLAKFTEAVSSVAISPDGRLVAAGSRDGTAQIFDVANGRMAGPKIELLSPVRRVLFDRDSRLLAIATDGRRVTLADAIRGAKQAEFRQSSSLPREINFLYFTPDKERLLYGGGDWFIGEMAQGQIKSPYNPLETGVSGVFQGLGFNKDGRLSAHTGALKKLDTTDEQTARFGPVTTGRNRSDTLYQYSDALSGRSFELDFGKRVNEIEISEDGSTIAIATDLNELYVGTIGSGAKAQVGEMSSQVISLALSQDGFWLAAGDEEGTLRLFDVRTRRAVGEVQTGPHPVLNLQFSPDGRFLAASSGTIIRLVELMPSLTLHRSVIPLDPNGGHAVQESWMTALRQPKATVFDTRSWQAIHEFGLGASVNAARLSSDGKKIAIGGDSLLVVRDILTGKVLWEKKQDMPVQALAFSPDGRFMHVARGNDTYAVLARCSADNGEELETFSLPQVSALEYSPGGSKIAIRVRSDKSPFPNALMLCDAADGTLIASKEFGPANAMSMSPDGRFIAAGTDRALVIRHLSENLLATETSIRMPVGSCCFTPDSQCILVGGGDGSLRLIDTGTWREVARCDEGGGREEMMFSPDGRCIVVGKKHDMLKMIDPGWFQTSDTASFAWRQFLCLQSGREFGDSGLLNPLTATQLAECRDQARSYANSPAHDKESWQHAVLNWWQMLPEKRTISPWHKKTIREATGRTLMAVVSENRDDPTIPECARQAPWHPLVPLSVARRGQHSDSSYVERFPQGESAIDEVEKSRRQFLVRQTLGRLRDADESLYGRPLLAKYAAWTASILKDELGLVMEARDAQKLATELTRLKPAGH